MKREVGEKRREVNVRLPLFFLQFFFLFFIFRINFRNTSNSVRNINTLTLLLFVLGKSVRPPRADFLFSPAFSSFFLKIKRTKFLSYLKWKRKIWREGNEKKEEISFEFSHSFPYFPFTSLSFLFLRRKGRGKKERKRIKRRKEKKGEKRTAGYSAGNWRNNQPLRNL